jgi:Flp pilus assembly protein TadB
MSALLAVLRELAGLFVEDGSLVLAILGVVVLAALVATLTPGMALAAGAILLFGCLGVLLVNAIRAARRAGGS